MKVCHLPVPCQSCHFWILESHPPESPILDGKELFKTSRNLVSPLGQRTEQQHMAVPWGSVWRSHELRLQVRLPRTRVPFKASWRSTGPPDICCWLSFEMHYSRTELDAACRWKSNRASCGAQHQPRPAYMQAAAVRSTLLSLYQLPSPCQVRWIQQEETLRRLLICTLFWSTQSKHLQNLLQKAFVVHADGGSQAWHLPAALRSSSASEKD